MVINRGVRGGFDSCWSGYRLGEKRKTRGTLNVSAPVHAGSFLVRALSDR